MRALHLLLGETAGEQQAKIDGLDRLDVGIPTHRALFTAVIRLAWFALASAATPAGAVTAKATEPAVFAAVLAVVRHGERHNKGVTMTDRVIALKRAG